jgi:hypothetical protein
VGFKIKINLGIKWRLNGRFILYDVIDDNFKNKGDIPC